MKCALCFCLWYSKISTRKLPQSEFAKQTRSFVLQCHKTEGHLEICILFLCFCALENCIFFYSWPHCKRSEKLHHFLWLSVLGTTLPAKSPFLSRVDRWLLTDCTQNHRASEQLIRSKPNLATHFPHSEANIFEETCAFFFPRFFAKMHCFTDDAQAFRVSFVSLEEKCHFSLPFQTGEIIKDFGKIVNWNLCC